MTYVGHALSMIILHWSVC